MDVDQLLRLAIDIDWLKLVEPPQLVLIEQLRVVAVARQLLIMRSVDMERLQKREKCRVFVRIRALVIYPSTTNRKVLGLDAGITPKTSRCRTDLNCGIGKRQVGDVFLDDSGVRRTDCDVDRNPGSRVKKLPRGFRSRTPDADTRHFESSFVVVTDMHNDAVGVDSAIRAAIGHSGDRCLWLVNPDGGFFDTIAIHRKCISGSPCG